MAMDSLSGDVYDQYNDMDDLAGIGHWPMGSRLDLFPEGGVKMLRDSSWTYV